MIEDMTAQDKLDSRDGPGDHFLFIHIHMAEDGDGLALLIL